MTKAAKIRSLLDDGLAPKQIAKKVRCREEYVRAVKHRRAHPQRYTRAGQIARYVARQEVPDDKWRAACDRLVKRAPVIVRVA